MIRATLDTTRRPPIYALALATPTFPRACGAGFGDRAARPIQREKVAYYTSGIVLCLLYSQLAGSQKQLIADCDAILKVRLRIYDVGAL